jgi:hypothetical protein
MAQGNTLVTKLRDALKAVDDAPASFKGREEIVQLRKLLTRVIRDLGTTPGPTPNVDN